ncbi:hypothetical protein [Solicola gregarius]|uniref:Secreted protein n=1 Tax=Solicola gregarius TaxID=2908642 RepID=A0AA46TGB8_9ACTN|nr:hypothetical protein [Solicola gregarius]UYM04625.1 hypothetical protein L0C25_19135 [Solicola gregarius]
MTNTRTTRLVRIAATCLAASVIVPPAVAAAQTEQPDHRARDKSTIGPKAYKSLHLGMSKKKAVKTGLLRDPEKIGKCTWYYLKASQGAMNPGNGVIVSPKHGLVNLPGTDTMHTPEGIRMGSINDHLGSLAKRIRHAYKRYAYDEISGPPTYIVPTPGNRKAHYSFVIGGDHRVKDLALTLDKNGCGLGGWPY